MPCLTLRQACHHFDGERVATVAVAVATTLEDRGEQVVSAGERSDAQVRDKSVEVAPAPATHLNQEPAIKSAQTEFYMMHF